MFCGAGSFKTLDDDAPSAPVTPRQKRRKSGGKSNPYSSRGLDKFSTVLTELESRKEKIIASTAGSDDRHHVLVRFKHTGSKDWVPIVVRLPDDQKEHVSTDLKGSNVNKRGLRKTMSMPTSPQPLPVQTKDETSEKVVEDGKKTETKRGYNFSWLTLDRTRPRSYWPWVGVIVLLSLVFFGRAFAVCCTSIWWYLVPTLIGEDLDTLQIARNTNRKRNILRKKSLSDEKIGGRINITPPSSSSSPPSSSPRVLLPSSNNKEKPKRLCSF